MFPGVSTVTFADAGSPHVSSFEERMRVVSVGSQHFPALVLNADFRPLSYFPLSLWSWQEAMKAVFLERVSVISEYDNFVHSPSQTFRLPSVIALKDYIPRRETCIHPLQRIPAG